MSVSGRTYYPFVWFDRGGWWFKALGEHFGPYECSLEARHNLGVIMELEQQIETQCDRRSLFS